MNSPCYGNNLHNDITFQEPTGFVVGMNLISCMGHWVTYLYEHDRLHIDILIWIVDRILTFLPRVLSQMNNRGIYDSNIDRSDFDVIHTIRYLVVSYSFKLVQSVNISRLYSGNLFAFLKPLVK